MNIGNLTVILQHVKCYDVTVVLQGPLLTYPAIYPGMLATSCAWWQSAST